MDEILHAARPERSGGKLRGMARAALDRLCGLGDWMEEHPISPLAYLTVATAIVLTAALGVTHAPGYVVAVDGAPIGVVADVAVYEQAQRTVEAQTTRLLGYDYDLEGEVTYTRALAQRDDFSTMGQLEAGLFDQIGQVVQRAVLTVDGKIMGAADCQDDLEKVLRTVAAPYCNANTVEYGFVEDVAITDDYVSARLVTDLDRLTASLTAEEIGVTTYTAAQGDSYSQIAQDNGLTVEELLALNPQADPDTLLVGDVLTVKESVPFLSVYTVDNLTYEDVILSPIQYVDDPDMYIGDTKVISQGEQGVALINADVTYVNGRESERTVLQSSVLTQPTTTLMARGTTPRPKTASTGTYITPCTGIITSPFGYRSIFGSYSFHSGVDIADAHGTPIVAADGGLVTFVGWKSGYGNVVIIDHDNGDQTYYAHNSAMLVEEGERVYQGQTIAEMGATGRSTGVHLHFEVRVDGQPQDPMKFIK